MATVIPRFFLSCLLTTLLVGVAVGQTQKSADMPLLRYTTTWIGNSFAGTKAPGLRNRKHVQLDVRAMFVTSDGTCYTAANWDEDGSEIGIYRDGDVLGSAGHTHGWGYGGGSAVTVSKDYLFFAQKVDNEGGTLKGADTWPVKGHVWYGISRRLRDGSPAPFEGGKGGDGDTLKGVFLPINETPEGTNAEITGLVTDPLNHLFASDPYNAQIKVYDTEKMALLHSWRIERPGALTLNSKGELWVVQTGTAEKSAHILHLNTEGRTMPDSFELPREVKPGGLVLDARGRLLLTDRGAAQQIYVYDTHNVPPALTETIGAKGGIFAGRGAEIGRDGPLRFHDPVGVGVDRTGNFYFCSSGSVPGGGGTVLESYDEDIKPLWRLNGLAFVDTADVDPASDGVHVYTKDKHFVMDFGKSKGQEATYRGTTANRLKYPDDPRLRSGDCGVFFRRIQGKPFLFVTDMYSGGLRLFRFKPDSDGECAIPAGYFAREHVKPAPTGSKEPWPLTQPEKGEWIWRDNNGNGTLDADEYDSKSTNAPGLWGWCVDSQGNVWQATEHDGIRKFPVQGLDKLGNPIYSYATMQTVPTPMLFTELCRVEYLPDTDTMFLSGYTTDHPHTGGEWGIVGTEIVRYEHWNQGNRTAAARVLLPYDGLKDTKKFIKSFAVAGDYLFAGEGREPCAIYVYNAKTGAPVGKLQPDATVGANSGWLDFPYAVRAFRRNNGEYLIFAEEDLDAKIILYRWKP